MGEAELPRELYGQLEMVDAADRRTRPIEPTQASLDGIHGWLAIHLAQDFIHPVVFTEHGPQLGGSQLFTFLVCLAAMLSLAACLYHVELAGKRLDARLKSLRELLA